MPKSNFLDFDVKKALISLSLPFFLSFSLSLYYIFSFSLYLPLTRIHSFLSPLYFSVSLPLTFFTSSQCLSLSHSNRPFISFLPSSLFLLISYKDILCTPVQAIFLFFFSLPLFLSLFASKAHSHTLSLIHAPTHDLSSLYLLLFLF